MIISTLRRLIECANGAAAVEAAIFAPIFLTLTLGVTDLGSGMFVRMTVNAATQAGAAYAVKNSCTSTCLTAIKTAMNDATGNPSFCTAPGTVCAATTLSPCSAAEPSTTCIQVSANLNSYSPILPDAVYSWAKSTTISSRATIRIQ